MIAPAAHHCHYQPEPAPIWSRTHDCEDNELNRYYNTAQNIMVRSQKAMCELVPKSREKNSFVCRMKMRCVDELFIS